MRVVGVPRLVDFCLRHADAKADLEAWLAEARAAAWRTPHEIRLRYPRASFVNGHVIFDIRNNRYRLDATVAYQAQVVVVVRVGTHADYDRWSFDV